MSRPIVTMPGKMGDVLLSLPVAREIAAMYRSPVSFITSSYCAPLIPLLRNVSYIAHATAIPLSKYEIQHTHFGAQPWLMPDDEYQRGDSLVWHLGFRRFPKSSELVSHLAGDPYLIKPQPGPWLPLTRRDAAGPVVVHWDGAEPAWLAGWLAKLGLPVVRLVPAHAAGELLPGERAVADYLEIWEALQGASLFVGAQSGPSKVAMGSGLPVVWPHREGVEQYRWAHPGCDVRSVDANGRVRTLSR